MDEQLKRSGAGPSPAFGPMRDAELDQDLEEWAAWADREILAGREPTPPERGLTQGIAVSLGDDDGIDPELLAAVCGVGGELGPQFAQGSPADVLPPGPALAALTEAAVTDVTRLTDNQLIGVLHAARRQESREAWKKTLVIAEFARRRAAEFDAATARGVPIHCRPGQFPGEELAIELLLGPIQTSRAIDDATDLATRLPATMAGMAAGLIDEARAGVIARYTRGLSREDVALADELLAALAPGLRPDQLARRADALEKKLDPEAAKARREYARQTRQRVEVRPEESGNASVAGREMDTADALAAKAHLHSLALRLRRAGLSGTLDQLRLLVFTDLTTGHDPLDRLPNSSMQKDGPSSREEPVGDTSGLEDARCGPPGRRPPAPMPATINLVVHAETLFGWDTTPSEAGGWGLLDVEETRAIVAAASRHPATRWCLTLLGRDGTAVAHGCSPGQHPWILGEQDSGPPSLRAPAPAQAAAFTAFLRSLRLTLEPIARGGCDHATAEPRYVPSRKLTHLVRARSATCDAPGCNAQAVHADLDHTVPYPDGPTDQCNLGPKCRRHHKAKQAPGWRVEQFEPGVVRWTLPDGRTHTTRPTVYAC